MSIIKFKTKAQRIVISAIACALAIILVTVSVFWGINIYNSYKLKRELLSSTICLDAGHGFKDSGAQNDLISPYTEADINYSITEKLAQYLTEFGIKVILLHDGTSIPKGYDVDQNGVFDVGERVTYSDALGAALYISIHCDSFESDPDVCGTRIYYQAQDSSPISSICSSIADSIDNSKICQKPTRLKPMLSDDAFAVIRNRGEMLSLLVECGFITNHTDAAMLCDSNWQSEFAKALAEGIKDFCEK